MSNKLIPTISMAKATIDARPFVELMQISSATKKPLTALEALSKSAMQHSDEADAVLIVSVSVHEPDEHGARATAVGIAIRYVD